MTFVVKAVLHCIGLWHLAHCGFVVEQRGPPDPYCPVGKLIGECPQAANNRPETRWYYNRTLEECMAYTYYGCGAYPNYPYTSWWKCSGACKRPKFESACEGTWPPYKDPTGKATDCTGLQCPQYYECRMADTQPPSPQCCSQAVTDAYGYAYAVTSQRCPNGAPHYSIPNPERTWMNDPYFGDSCADLICPSGYECTQINWIFAKCCQIGGAVPGFSQG